MNVYTAQGELTAPQFARCFAMNSPFKVAVNWEPGTWAGFGSPQTWEGLQRSIAAGEDWYYGDHAYFGRRSFYRITKNRYQHDGLTGKPDYSRLSLCGIDLRPWKTNGRDIIVCAQSAGHYERYGQAGWVQRTVAQLQKHTDRPIIVRTKADRPLSQDLWNAWAVVAHTSNAAVAALVTGIPVFTTADCAASAFGLRDLAKIESPVYPDGRKQWAGILAANQWNMEEIAAGIAWKALQA